MKLGLAAADLKTLYQTRIAPVAQRNAGRGGLPTPGAVSAVPGCRAGAGTHGMLAGRTHRPLAVGLEPSCGCRTAGGLAVAGMGAGQGQGNGSLPPAPGAGRNPDHLPSTQAGIPPGAPAAALVARGESAYLAEHFTEALAHVRIGDRAAPGQPIPRYDAAATLFQLQRYEEARQRYQEARDRARTALRTKIDYALGNTALVLGDVAGAVEHYDNCLASTAAGAGLDVVRQDAAINRQFALEQAPPSIPHRRARATVINLLPGSGIVRPERKRGDGGNGTATPDDPPGPVRNLAARTHRVKRTTGRRQAGGEAGGGGGASDIAARVRGRITGRPPGQRSRPDPRRPAPASPRIRQPNPPGTAVRTGEAMRPIACGLPARRISLATLPAISIMVPVLLLCMRIEPRLPVLQTLCGSASRPARGPYYMGQGIEAPPWCSAVTRDPGSSFPA